MHYFAQFLFVPALQHACEHLGFDAEGSFNVNEVAAAALLNRPEVNYKPNTKYEPEAFFEVTAAKANRVVDGFIDAQVRLCTMQELEGVLVAC